MALSCFCSHCGAENVPGGALCHACQQPLATSIGIQGTIPLLNERYEILTEVGSGGFGAVYKARDTQEQARLVAVKQINLKGLSPQEIIEATDAFNREAEILTSLSHPLLPRIYDRFSDPEHWYLVMNFIEGETLDDYLERQIVSALPSRRGLPLDQTLAIGQDLCNVLHYLHAQQPPVIFRDLKPGNIMRTPRGSLYLIDFGIARRFKPGQAKDTIPFGSPGFAAPEQYGRAQTTPQADIYSLGALLYCLISGDDPSEHPFQFPPLRLPNVDGLRELEGLISRMVALEPARRPADVRAVRAELQHIQYLHIQASQRSRIWTPPQGQTPLFASANGGQQHIFQAPGGSAPAAPARKTTRRRVLTVGLLAGGAALVGGIALVNRNPGQVAVGFQNQPMTNTTVDAQNLKATENAIYSSPNLPDFWSPDMTHRATVFADVNSMKNKISLYTDQGRQLFNTLTLSVVDPTMTVLWSPNNKRVALLESATVLCQVWDTQNGHQLSILQASWQDPNSPIVWSPDGKYLAVSADSQYLFIINAASGESLLQQSFPLPIGTALTWTPDNRFILVPVAASAANADTWTIEMWDSQVYKRVGVIADLPQLDASSFSSISSIVCSPTGDQYAFTYQNFLWLGNLNDVHSAHQLTRFTGEVPGSNGSAEAVSSLLWSPNAQYLAILYGNVLRVWSASTGQQMHLDNAGEQDNINAFAWTADSKSVLVVGNEHVVLQWSVF